MGTSVAPAPALILQFLNNAGVPNVGGSILTQVGGVNYPTFQDAAGTTPLPNPIPLNSRGEISNTSGVSSQLYLALGVTYVFTLMDTHGNMIWTAQNVQATGGQVGTLTDEDGSDGTPGFKATADFTPGTTETLTLSGFYGSASNLWVAFDGAEQGANTFQLSGHTLTFGSYIAGVFTAAPIPVGVTTVFVKGGTTFTLGTPGTGTVTDQSVAANANINSSKLGFLQKGAGAVNRMVLSKLQDVYSVMDFGAIGTGATGTDDTASCQACITQVGAIGGGEVYFPSGTYNISATLTVPANVILKGNGGDGGVGGTTINLLSATLDGIVLNGARTGVAGFFMTSPVTRTAGRAIFMPIGLSSVDNVWIEHYNIAIEADGGLNFLTNINIRNPSTGNSIGILINGSADQHITNLIIGADFSSPAAFAGVQVVQSGGLWMTDCDITLCQNGMLINPQSGQEVQFLFLKNVTCDTSSNNGWTVVPDGTGFVAGMNMIGCWGASSVNSGMLFAPTDGAIIDGVWMSTPQVVNNSGIGINISGAGGPVKNFNITGGCVSGNSVTSPLAHDGIVIGVGCSNITLNGMRVGPSQNLGGDSQNNQINVLAGTQSDINITNCDVTTANTPITFSSTGSNNSIVNCPGYRTAQRLTASIPVGQAAVAVPHNLNAPNSAINAMVSPNNILGSAGVNSLSVESTFGAGTVTVTANAAVTATLSFTLDLRAYNS